MGFEIALGLQSRRHYERLNVDEKLVAKPGKRWAKRMNGSRLKGIKLTRSRKLTFKALSVIFMPRIGAIYAEIVKRLKMDGVYPTIIFSSQWGLPVLSHPSASVRCRKNVVAYL